MEKNTADCDPKHLISFGPFKKHVLDVVRPLMFFDLGYCSNLVMLLVMAPSFTTLIPSLIIVAPAVLTLIAIIFFSLWTIFLVLNLLMITDLYKMMEDNVVKFPDVTFNSPFIRFVCVVSTLAIVELFIYINLKVHYVLWRFLKEEEMAKREAVHQPFNHPSAPPAAYQGSYQGYEAPQPQLVLNNVY
ncbi:hypothetical protein PRIPAC_89369 [Pristionchus pacificus]|uniref:Uncharacterized protein n=1 Tax=Pristionchus pacificus TaxID=54126 RepID=A0A2A6B6T9_PRIPA|nr:hypothetical protein PRIPAC_89369 [Pristionchus pacificus]|eukprot:PDM61595.1 hypothetical protein PRIPAC_51037 [Pristionchus pacificus]